MSWRVMGAAHFPFGFVDPPEHLTVENDTTHATVRYVPERTCRNKARYGNFRCGTCAAFLQVTDLDEDPNLLVDGVGHMPSYCPNCGAKVVEA